MRKLLVLVPALVALAMFLPLVSALALAAVLGGGSEAGTPGPSSPSPATPTPTPPQAIVSLDQHVAAAPPPLVPCHIPPAALIAQQDVESGFTATAISPTGAEGLAQFEPATWVEYSSGLPPPDSPFDPTDAAIAEARYLCSLGFNTNPFNALVAYNCGNASASCVAASSGYATEILSIAMLWGRRP
jgi:hypothetical protein